MTPDCFRFQLCFGSRRFLSASLRLCGSILLLSLAVFAQPPSPGSVLGFQPTDDKTIADWRQITDYLVKLDKASGKVLVREIGRSTNGRPLIVAFVSSSDNIKNLERYRRISAKLADPRTVKNDAEAYDLVKNGKTIVAISCSIHSTEIVASQMSMNLAYELAVAKDAETKEILDNTILLLIPSPNPDGIDIVADWYRKTLGTKSEGTPPPELYHHYAGHDNNRDWFMLNLAETQAVTKLFWQEWFPQIVYDIHQQGQNASRFVIPPFFDPANPRIAPLILRETGLIGYKMAADLQAQGIKGVATNATFDTWWHGGFRSAPYFHNSIGILSEAASARLMSPVKVQPNDLVTGTTRGLESYVKPATNHPDPWPGGDWSPRDIAAMEMIASRSVLQMAAKFRMRYLRNFYEQGKKNDKYDADEPRAFIIPAGQSSAETISRFLEILMWQGIEVREMTRELYVKTAKTQTEYHEMPLGSFLIFVNQPQKNNILSLFERQVYPDRRTASGEAEAPYDVAGWTLPLQMGVEYEPVWQFRDEERGMLLIFANIDLQRAHRVLNLRPPIAPFAAKPNPLRSNPRIGLYKGFTSSMDEGWTRFVLDTFQIPFRSISDSDMRSGNLDLDALILPADNENLIVRGLNSAERYSDEFSGGVGETGVENLKRFVTNGGKLICFDDSCDMVIKRFGLPIINVLAGVKRSEFYNPGSILRLDVDTKDPLARNVPPETAAYFISSSAYDITDERTVRTVAQYAAKDALLSGWMLGEQRLNGKTALAETTYGKGKIILFAFRPQHRGQTWATFPFVFNALEK